MKLKIRLDTMSDIKEFVDAATKASSNVTLTDDNGFTVNAKSLLGVMYTMEWNDVYCNCDHDIYHLIRKFVVE